MKASDIPVSLYIHTPWCLHKCPYCDFNSHAQKGELPEEAYIDTLLQEFQEQASLLQGRQLQTIFIGGGTPSLLSASSYKKLFTGLEQITDLNETNEITLEANPGTFEQQRFADYRAAGINRLSIGVQSFQEQKLKRLERIHDNKEAINAIQTAQSVGFDNLNIDLMYGLPDQNLEEALEDLQQAIDLNPTHISWYQLTLEPNTLFHHSPPTLPEDESIWEMQIAGQALLEKNGFHQYEVSAYAKEQKQCRHNRNYWSFGDYIGIGAGAHGKITNFLTQNIVRRWNRKNPRDYLNPNRTVLAGYKSVTTEERPLEFMMNALRLKETLPLAQFKQRTGLSPDSIKATLESAQEQGFLSYSNQQVELTKQGYIHLDALLTLF